MRTAATVVLVAAAAAAQADEVWLKGGGRIVGDVLENTGRSLVVATGPGTVTVPLGRVEHVVSSPVALTEYRQRAARLGPRDVAGWSALAEWAGRNDLPTQAREAWGRVVAADPGHVAAHRALGDVLHEGRWMDFADAQRARGLVEEDGDWMTPDAREAMVVRRDAAEASAREQAAIADLARSEAEARAREAEARARIAEAEAARAEADAASGGGVPFAYAYGTPVLVGSPYGNPYAQPRRAFVRRGPHRGHAAAAPRPTAPPRDRGRPSAVAPARPVARDAGRDR